MILWALRKFNLIKIFEKEIDVNFTNLWDKINAWFKGEVQVVENFLTKEEQQVLSLIKPILSAAEPAVIQDLVQFITGVLVGSASYSSLADWETAILNGLEKVGGELKDVGKGLGSNVLQALIGLILAQLPKV